MRGKKSNENENAIVSAAACVCYAHPANLPIHCFEIADVVGGVHIELLHNFSRDFFECMRVQHSEHLVVK